MFSHSSHWLTVAGGRGESASAWGSFGGVVVALASAAAVTVVALAVATEVVCAHAVTSSPVVPCQRGTTTVPPFRVAGDRCVVSLLVDFRLFRVEPSIKLSNRLLSGVATCTIAAAVRADVQPKPWGPLQWVRQSHGNDAGGSGSMLGPAEAGLSPNLGGHDMEPACADLS